MRMSRMVASASFSLGSASRLELLTWSSRTKCLEVVTTGAVGVVEDVASKACKDTVPNIPRVWYRS